jgi:hypothetical protein
MSCSAQVCVGPRGGVHGGSNNPCSFVERQSIHARAATRKREEGRMKARALAAAMLLTMGAVPASSAVRISDDHGGQLGPYLDKYRALRQSGERVEIDGVCASACTMLLGLIPPDRICVTPRAVLEFHSAWDINGDQSVSDAGTRLLWSHYPVKIRAWINRHGGLRSRIIYLRWPELATMYSSCR